MGTVITIGQCFGIMPVIGVKQASAAKLSFAWLSFRSIYSIIVAVAAIAYAFVQFWHSFHQKIEFGTFCKHYLPSIDISTSLKATAFIF